MRQKGRPDSIPAMIPIISHVITVKLGSMVIGLALRERDPHPNRDGDGIFQEHDLVQAATLIS